MKKIVTFIIFALLLVTDVNAKKKGDLDHISLAALLIKDGHYDRALTALKEVDLKDEDTDFVRLYTLKALAFMKKDAHKKAIENFLISIEKGQKDQIVYIYLAQSHFKLEAYQEALDAFAKADMIRASKPQYFALQAQCQWKLERHEEAFELLDAGLKLFSKFATFHKQKFFYLSELKLFEEAMGVAEAYIEQDENAAEAYQIVGSALSRAGELDRAILILEAGKLQFPKNSDIVVMLAHFYIKKEKIQVAAELFDQASIIDSKYIKEASELYRRAKKLYRSLYFNTQIKDQKEKYKQRLAILLEFGDYEMAAAMEQTLKRIDLIKDEDIRYALAFTLFQTAQYDKCEDHLSQLMRSDLFSKGIELRKSIENCKKSPWECY